MADKNKKNSHSISLRVLQNSKCDTYMKKDNSVRGCSCVSVDTLKVGDEVVINNYFTEIVE